MQYNLFNIDLVYRLIHHFPVAGNAFYINIKYNRLKSKFIFGLLLIDNKRVMIIFKNN